MSRELGADKASPDSEAAARLFEKHRGFLWGLTYRLTGNAADADDIVQETFVRAIARPPAIQDRDWRPWLIRVAINLGRDLLRYRRRRAYVGTWLPSPVDVEPPSYEPAAPTADPASRYDLMESVSFAFLLALEALTPMQRAVLLLRDVFDYSVRETAHALGISQANARTTHLRARRAIRGYEALRLPPSRARSEAAQTTLERFLACVSQGDVAAVEELLAADVRALTDGGGEFHANAQPIAGRASVARFFVRLAKQSGPAIRIDWRILNGQPALVVERSAGAGFASRFIVTADIDAAGCLTRIYTVLASRKLMAVRGSGAHSPEATSALAPK